MPGEPYEVGGMARGLSDMFWDTKELALAGFRGAARFGRAVERRGSTLPLLRRLSLRPSPAEYEAIPLVRPESV